MLAMRASTEKLPHDAPRRMRVTADGKRRRDRQVGVFEKAPAVTVLDARPGRAQLRQTGGSCLGSP
jgi:hypothetical protein